MTLTLFQRELDVWEPAAHNGTFRGNTPEFVTACLFGVVLEQRHAAAGPPGQG